MKPDIKQKWLGALRSGEYKQGQRMLRSEKNEYCCLGVLCHIVDPSRWIATMDNRCYGYNSLMHDTMPGAAVCESVGLPIGEAEKLAEMNDVGVTFEGIANYIEQKL